MTQHSCLLFFDVSGNLFNKTFIHFCFRLKWNIPLYPNALNLMYTDRLELYSQQVTFQGIQYGNMNPGTQLGHFEGEQATTMGPGW